MPASLANSLREFLAQAQGRVGEICIRPEAAGWELRHHLDADAPSSDLTQHEKPEAARELAKYDEAGQFRPLKSAPTLRQGWLLKLESLPALQVALDYFYPAALANWVRHQTGDSQPVPLRETLNRQTGMYRITGLLETQEAEKLVAETCHPTKCARQILWGIEPGHPPPRPSAATDKTTIPLLCCEACNLLVAAARTVVKSRPK